MQTQTEKITVEKETAMPDIASDAVKLAVVNTEIKHMNETMQRLESKFDTAISTFVTNEKLADAQKRADDKHKEQDRAIKKLEDQNTWIMRTVGTLVIGAVIGGVMFIK